MEVNLVADNVTHNMTLSDGTFSTTLDADYQHTKKLQLVVNTNGSAPERTAVYGSHGHPVYSVSFCSVDCPEPYNPIDPFNILHDIIGCMTRCYSIDDEEPFPLNEMCDTNASPQCVNHNGKARRCKHLPFECLQKNNRRVCYTANGDRTERQCHPDPQLCQGRMLCCNAGETCKASTELEMNTFR